MTQGNSTTYFTASKDKKYLVLHWYYIGIVLQYWSPGIVLVLYCLKKTSIVHPWCCGFLTKINTTLRTRL